MQLRAFQRPLATCVALVCLLVFGNKPSFGAVLEISGEARARVVQFGTGIPTQSDFSQTSVPGTVAMPPAIATAQIDRLREDSSISAGGQALSVFDTPNLSGFGNPNDVGFDLSCFTDDEETTWFVEGVARETRLIVLQSGEAGTGLPLGGQETAASRIILSGVMLITSLDPQRDLTGVESELRLRVVQRLMNGDVNDLVAGTLVLSGGPLGEVTVSEATGVFATNAPPVIDFSSLVISLPLVKAIVFAGLEIPYTYNFTPGEEFELDLEVASELRNIPGGTGASAVFGLPQGGLGDVLARVKEDDRGEQLEAVIAQQVDTTGAAYINGGFPFFSLCGATGIESGLMLLACGGLMRRHHRRRRRFDLDAGVTSQDT